VPPVNEKYIQLTRKLTHSHLSHTKIPSDSYIPASFLKDL